MISSNYLSCWLRLDPFDLGSMWANGFPCNAFSTPFYHISLYTHTFSHINNIDLLLSDLIYIYISLMSRFVLCCVNMTDALDDLFSCLRTSKSFSILILFFFIWKIWKNKKILKRWAIFLIILMVKSITYQIMWTWRKSVFIKRQQHIYRSTPIQ